MKIAFTSCMSVNAYPDHQPVWSQIESQKPDVLVLLGDSVYNDCPPYHDKNGNPHPSNTGTSEYPGYLPDDFCLHLHDLYKRQLAIPEFRSLLAAVPTYAIWDDHDFLWNDAGAGFSRNNSHIDKAYYSSTLFNCWREALAKKGAGFPSTHDDPSIQGQYANLVHLNYDDFMPGYKNQLLAPNLVLHLTDGRSWRKGSSILGKNQRQLLGNAIENTPAAIHIIASGSTFTGKHTQGWAGYSDDYDWLLKLAANYKILMFSGDIHKNRIESPINTNTTNKFFEIVSSGAAVDFLTIRKDGRSSPKNSFNYSEHFGILEFKNDAIEVSLYDHMDPKLTQKKSILNSFTGFKP